MGKQDPAKEKWVSASGAKDGRAYIRICKVVLCIWSTQLTMRSQRETEVAQAFTSVSEMISFIPNDRPHITCGVQTSGRETQIEAHDLNATVRSMTQCSPSDHICAHCTHDYTGCQGPPLHTVRI